MILGSHGKPFHPALRGRASRTPLGPHQRGMGIQNSCVPDVGYDAR